LGLPNSIVAKLVRQARIDRGDFGPPDQGQLISEESVEPALLRKENRELRREKDCFRLTAAYFANEQLPREVSPDRNAGRPFPSGLAL
jgi:transposase-like protein